MHAVLCSGTNREIDHLIPVTRDDGSAVHQKHGLAASGVAEANIARHLTRSAQSHRTARTAHRIAYTQGIAKFFPTLNSRQMQTCGAGSVIRFGLNL
eukprot:5026173-Amphidinium_carterae.1